MTKKGIHSLHLGKTSFVLRFSVQKLSMALDCLYNTCTCLIPFSMGVYQGVAMDSLKLHLGLPCLTLLRTAGRQSLKRPYGHFRDGPPTERAACGRPLPFWTPLAMSFSFYTIYPHFLCLMENRGVWRGVSKGLEDGHRPPALR
jgi:hypothetical protein